ncbi:MAG: serine--tRNA ligase [Fibrobacteres bacterium]|nr:serine--tRNA ligase [Fibrobacterota bacterium]
MINPRLIRENPELLRKSWLRRGLEAPVDRLVELDEARRSLISVVESAKAAKNAASAEVGKLKREGSDASEAIAAIKSRGDEQAEAEAKLAASEKELEEILMGLPNLPHESVPEGRSSDDNVVARTWGEIKDAPSWAKDHLQVGEALKLFDFKRGAKISGAGFPVYTGWGARLERALIAWFLDEHRQAGFLEVQPPLMVNRAAMTGTGNLPKFADQLYTCTEDELFLIPTAEVPVTNLHADEILDPKEMPVKYCAYTACFRREAGSYGKDTKGFLRLHQFDKVEMVWFSQPESSQAAHETLTAQAESLVKKLGLPYRTLLLCSGDMGFGASKCYDIEVWAPVEKKWLEVSSCSNFEDFQARRASIRTRGADGKPVLAHTLNGSGLATPRILVALLETYQQQDGSLLVPEVLRPYLGGIDVLRA